MAGFDNDIVYAANADFTRADNQVPSETNGLITNGQLWIGRTAVNAGGTHIDVGTLTGTSGITITNGAGTIAIAVNGSTVGQTITGDTGGALSPTSGNWNLLGQNVAGSGVQTTGSGSTLSYRMLTPYSLGGFSFTGGDVDVTRALAGGSVFASINNTDNTNTASNARLTIQTGGTSSGDPTLRFTVPGFGSWSQGIDTSDANKFKMEKGTSLGTNPFFEIDPTALAPTFLSGLAGTPFVTIVKHTVSQGASSATMQTLTAGAAGGDPQFQASVSGVTQWTWGIDNSVTSPTADPFVIAQGTALGTNNVMSVATSGEINYPLQPAFLAVLQTADLNVTGDGTTYTLGSGNALTEIFDQNSDFSTTTFTAPVTGRYNLGTRMLASGLAAATTYEMRIVTSNRGYYYGRTLAANSNNQTLELVSLCDMDSGDTATFTYTVSGVAGLTGDIYGTASPVYSACWGNLVC